jgi:hypothetical protein
MLAQSDVATAGAVSYSGSHPERSEGEMTGIMPPSLRSG